MKKKTAKPVLLPAPEPPGNLRITLRLHPAVVQTLDELNAYIPQGDRADMVRFLMNLGIKQIRLEQSARDQVDVFQKFTSVLSSEMERAAAGKESDMFPPAPEPPSEARKRRTRKGSGSSSTGTTSH